MYNQPQASQKKREQFANSIRSEQRRKIFAEQRKKLEQARMRQDEVEMAQAQMQLMEIFNNHSDQYERMMAMADELEKQEREFEEYMARLEEESVNYEMMQKKKLIQEIKKQMLEQFQP